MSMMAAVVSASAAPAILGFDAAGTIEAVGAEVSTLSVGDEVWYAGDITRQGSNAELQAVDDGVLRSTVTKSIGSFDATGLTEAHADVESGRMVGKVVVHR